MGTAIKIPSTKFGSSSNPDDGVAVFQQEHESGWKRWTIYKQVTVSAAANATVGTCPANSVIDGWALEAQAVGAAPVTTGTHLGLGISGDPDKFDEVIEASIDNSDTYVDTGLMAAPVAQAAAADILLASTNGSGAAAGSFTGTWNVVVTGRTFIGFGS